jgi:hypothetical protein
MLDRSISISHTNDDRINLFKQDNIDKHLHHLTRLPNFPPESWYRQSVKREKASITRFVYIGSLSLEALYIKQFAQWVKEENGGAELDIYSNNYKEDVIDYLKELNCKCIKFKGEVNYYSLPDLLPKYDVGLILYKGSLPNHIYCVPNKMLEYYACGLKVLFSAELISSLKFKQEFQLASLIPVDFSKQEEYEHILSKIQAASHDTVPFTCEKVYDDYLNFIFKK